MALKPQIRLLLTGATGQVGSAIAKALASNYRHVTVIADRCDLADSSTLQQHVRKTKPQLIINCGAYTAVDKAESEPSLAYAINATAPGILADEAKKIGAAIIHFSTDYVFDGRGHHPWREDDPTKPLNVYGASKLAGEIAITAGNPAHFIFRTSWVFSAQGQNFLKSMLRLGKERETLKIVSDQIGAPTSASFLAHATLAALDKVGVNGIRELSGTYHLCCAGTTNWHAFATAIFQRTAEKNLPLKVRQVVPISSDDYPTAAQRPKNSRLDCGKFCTTFAVSLAEWSYEMKTVIDELALAYPRPIGDMA